jgi:Subtilase family
MQYSSSSQKTMLSITLGLLAITFAPLAQAQTPKVGVKARAQQQQDQQNEDGLTASVLDQISSLEAWRKTLTPAQNKIDTQLLFTAKMAKGQPITDKVATLRTGVTVEPFDRVPVEIKGKVTPELVTFVRASGATITAIPRKKTVIYAKVALQNLEAIASRPEVRRISYAFKPKTNRKEGTGSVTSNGNTVIGAGLTVSQGLYAHDIARIQTQVSTNYGEPVLGQNMRVGVLSDSNRYQDLSQGYDPAELPSFIQVLVDDFGVVQDGIDPNDPTGSNGEGTAMMEIVHDLAPGSELVFATAFNGEESFAQNILDLRFKMGCDIIVDDVQYATESPFQDGAIAQAVATVRADGALYFSAAGNSGNAYSNTSCVWEGDFVPASLSTTPFQKFVNSSYNINQFSSDYVFLFWGDALGKSANDYNLYDVDATGRFVRSAGIDLQTGNEDPFEYVISNPGERLYVRKASGQARFVRLEMPNIFSSDYGSLLYNTTGSTRGHNGSSGAITVGAVGLPVASYSLFNASQGVEYFTSDGPRREFYKGDGTPFTPGNFLAGTNGGRLLNKPNISAADGVSTTVPDFFNPFYGTSAAAPHAAAIAALVRSANLDVPSEEVARLMRENTIDTLTLGYDAASGNGIVMGAAVDALTQFLNKPTVKVSDTSAVVTWTSKNPVESYLEYGLTTTYGTTVSDITPKRTHSVTLTGLTPSTTYNFDLKGTYYGYTQTSQNYTFRTTAGVPSEITLTGVLLRREARTGNLLADITLQNSSTATATGVVVDGASLGVSSPVPITQTPITLGDMVVGSKKTFTIRFGSQRTGTTPILRLTGKSNNGATPTFSLSYKTIVP